MAGALAALSASAVWFVFSNGWLHWYGDAEAHLNISRNIIDNRTPGYDQLGTVWLPLPHVLMVPFVRIDSWWHNGLAAFPAAAFFVAGGTFLFAAARRIFDSTPAALATTAFAALNPNLLYLQSTSMTEGYFFGELMATLYFTARFRDTGSLGSAAGAGIAVCAATLTRYEGWFLIPFVAGYIFFTAPRRRFAAAVLFGAIASAGPLYWMAHNWYLTGDPLDFFRGPYSPRAIQGEAPYPGYRNWRLSWMYYRAAVELCAGPALGIIALAGAVVALARRAFWPLLLLALPPFFYMWSNYSSGGTPIFVPNLWPHSWYNTRYGLAALPLLAFAAAALVMAVPVRLRPVVAVLAIVAGTVHWAAHPQPEAWITWAESRANSEGRRAWTRETAAYLAPRYVPGSGIITSFSDLTGIFRQMRIPLSETFTGNNGIPWEATVRRPDLFLNQEWAIVGYRPGRRDILRAAIQQAARDGIRYDLKETIAIKNEPVIEIYHYSGGRHSPQ